MITLKTIPAFNHCQVIRFILLLQQADEIRLIRKTGPFSGSSADLNGASADSNRFTMVNYLYRQQAIAVDTAVALLL